MSDSTLVREPTWSGLSPGLPRWQEADPADSWILSAAGLEGRLLSQVHGSGPSSEFYRLERDEAPPLFLKRAEADRRSLLMAAESIGRWLGAKGVPVAMALRGFPLSLPDGTVLVAMSYVDGRRVAANANDLAALGSSISLLHHVLAAHPDVKEWRETTRRRLDQLQSTRVALAEGRLVAGPNPTRLAALSNEAGLDFIDSSGSWHPLHGDLNPGNVLMSDGEAMLLDFEDVQHSMHPPFSELCLAVERFVLTQVADDDEAVRLGRAFLEGYGQRDGYGTDMSPVATLRSRALRSLCLLTSAEQAGQRISEAEWCKFFDLDRMVLSRAKTLEAVFQ